MRAQLLAHALQNIGATVQMLTTSDDGARFLAGFGIAAPVLSRYYAVQFDAQQNMLKRETDRNVAHYVFRPARMLRDMVRLRAWARDADLVINDSFHPALLFMGCLPQWRRKVVHVYGASLRQALEGNFQGRLPHVLAGFFQKIVARLVDSAHACVEHDFACAGLEHGGTRRYRLPTPVALARENANAGAARAAVYLNPHFRDPLLAQGLEQGLVAAGLARYCVGEGYRDRAGWVAQDPDWVTAAANSDILISAPGMAALTVARLYQKPILLVVTDQPEQKINATRAAELNLAYRAVIWRGDARRFGDDVRAACAALTAAAPQRVPPAIGNAAARDCLDLWVSLLIELTQQRPVRPNGRP